MFFQKFNMSLPQICRIFKILQKNLPDICKLVKCGCMVALPPHDFFSFSVGLFPVPSPWGAQPHGLKWGGNGVPTPFTLATLFEDLDFSLQFLRVAPGAA